MHIISKKKIREFSQTHSQAELPLLEWYLKMQAANPNNLVELRKIFNSADPAYGYTIFNIGGNSYRLITAIHYDRRICYIRKIWTHTEYSKEYNQEKLRGGNL